ncbi:MAG: hypothetical protein ABL927_09400 [Bdellovibrionales bacterium]
MSNKKRTSPRKETQSIDINDLTSISNYTVIARYGKIVNASSAGILIEINRTALVPDEYRDNLSLESSLGQTVVFYLPQMNLDLEGTIMRASHIGKGKFVIGINFASDVPDYWRECLVDLLPSPGEFDESAVNE